ncbi:MAG TPA: ribosomal protein S18-alanine N-acetyltransferase [Galbitalea sp.]|jgi:ribosomal-protein-alanine acetyltransferase|nr:ribosomal protein S18-alanine N-acetyltransferase [Galbitalea sp.]
MDFEIRRATPHDLEAIMALEIATFVEDAWSFESMSSELGSEHTYYLVAFEPERPEVLVGYAGLLAPDGGDGEIQTIAVAPAMRRKGLGRLLMERLIAEAEIREASQVFLEVRADNPNAHELYESLGFEQIAVRRGYYQPGNVDAQVMCLPLERSEPDAPDEDDV